MTPDLPLAYAYGDNRRTTKGLTRDHRPLPTLRTFVSLLPLAALTFPPAPFLSSTARGKGKVSVAVATLRLRLSTIPRPPTSSPLSRSAGAGLGVRAALTFPPTPFLSRTAGEEGGMLPLTFLLALFRSSTASGRGDAAPIPSFWPSFAPPRRAEGVRLA